MSARLLVFLALAAALLGCGGSSSSSGSSSSALTFSPASGSLLPVAAVGSIFSQTIGVTSGGTPPFTFTLVTGPAGLTLATVDSRDATLSGTPTAAGVGIVQIKLNDSLNHTTFVSFQIEVNPGPTGKLTITPTSIPQATRPQSYTVFFTAQGGRAPFTWSQGGSLPAGVTLQSSTTQTDSISGTPTQAGSFAFTLTVTDSSSPPLTGTASLTLQVN